MDGLETTETENTVETAEIKEQSAEEDAEAEVDNSKQPVPALQRSVSEESSSSLVSVGVEAKISEQLCAFCYCGEKSSLGQGDLKQFRVTPGFILPWKNQTSNKKDVDDNSNGTCEKTQNSAPRKQRGQRKNHDKYPAYRSAVRERSPQQNIVSYVSVSTQTASDDQAGKLWDELSLVGLPDAIDVQALFDPTGTCWAHHRCVEWSLGVCQMEEPLLVNVDRAVVSGSTERCAFCKHLGATIKCCEEKCTQTYHYPCAAGAGTFQDFSHFFLLCPEHIDQAPERCWQCPECKVCQNCKQSGEDSKMLVCDTCDKGYHTFCLQPVMKSVPTNGWKCKNCRICVECGTRSSSQWHHNCLVCDSCYQQQDNLCPFCGKCYHPELQKDMLHCNMCKRWVHLECDKPTDHELDSQLKEEYICLYCKHLAELEPGDEVEMAELAADYNNEMEVEGSEDHMVFLEQAVDKEVNGQESIPGIVPEVPVHTGEQQKGDAPESLNTHAPLVSDLPSHDMLHSYTSALSASVGNIMPTTYISVTPKIGMGKPAITKRKFSPGRPRSKQGRGSGFPGKRRPRGAGLSGRGGRGRSKLKSGIGAVVLPGVSAADISSNKDEEENSMHNTVVLFSSSDKFTLHQTPPDIQSEHSRDGEMDDSREGELMDCDGKSESSPEREAVDDETKGAEGTEGVKKRKRKPYRPGIGGFMVRQRSRTGQGKTKRSVIRKDSSGSVSEQLTSRDDGTADDPLADISEVLNTDEDILGIISDDLAKSVDHSAGMDIGPVADDPSSLPQPSVTQSSRPLSEEQLDGILSPELDRMVTDGAILGKLYKIPELGGKDVEDLFTAVLSPATTQPAPLPQPPPPPAPQLLPLHSQGTSPLEKCRKDKNPAFNPVASDPNSSWTSSAPTVEGDSDTMSNAQRSALKWEKEEALGEVATVAPVLYTNVNFPNLKEEFPGEIVNEATLHSETVWPTVCQELYTVQELSIGLLIYENTDRQKARDNRAALRINKVQMSNDSMKRQQQQDSIDPSSRIDSDLFKDPLKQRESEHEQEWKFRQQMRQKSKQQAKIEATQKLEQCGSDTPSSGVQSPATPQPGNGSMSPAQSFHKDLFTKQMPSTPTPVSSDDVFVKPQAPPPPPASSRLPVQESLSQSRASQPPSPQVFSPGSSSSRPPSPVDPYAKMVGTPRPPPGGHGFSRRNSAALVENCAPLSSVSRPAPMSGTAANRLPPVTDSCSSSTAGSDPYAKPPDTPRPVMADPFPKPLGLPRSPIVSEQTAKGPLAAGTNDHFPKPSLRTDAFQRQRIPDPYVRPLLTPAPLDGGPGPFKTPLQPPPSSQDPYGPVSQAPRRLSVDPYERPALTPRPRQKLREIILQQQQQKKMASRQEKGSQDPGAGPHPGPLQHWQPESIGQAFTRPPPPYPGNIRSPIVPPLGPRYAVFPKDPRGPYPDVTGMGMRPHGFRFGFPGGSHAETASDNLQITTQSSDGLEEKLDSDDPSVKELDVKDLEGVEVKDLDDEDLENLNLDTEDGKGDELDTLGNLETNDPNLDDLLRSGEFDIIAYTDPELDLGDKKSMFNEELDLNVPIDDKLDNQCVSVEPPKKEQEDKTVVPSDKPPWKKSTVTSEIKTEVLSPDSKGETKCENMNGGEKASLQSCDTDALEKRTNRETAGSSTSVRGSTQLPAEDGVQVNPGFIQEQPLLLQDLLDQERQEQQQQRQMQAMIRQRSEPFFPNIDFDAITDPIMKAKMVALKGINKVMAQNNMGMPPMVMNRFPFMGPSVTGAQTGEGHSLLPQAVTQDGSITHQISRPNPPNFGPGFVNDSQRKQYEEWLQETQQLLQMQQKYLEEQIGAHRKSKKALSAKQRTAKKAGREFPEEDAEQLKHVTEQQSMVQKQLEQIRKQQKEHAELIEDYRIKQQQQQQQQQCAMAPPTVMPGVQPQPPLVPGAPPPTLSQPGFPMVPAQLQHQQHAAVIGHSSPARMPSLPGWQPASAPSHLPLNPPRVQPPVAQLPIKTCTPAPGAVSNANPQSGPPPRVEFDDNNPFSESFQERERKERLREQQERQRIQLMQEVDRQRALQQRMEVEQHGVMGSELGGRTSVSQVPFYSSDLPCDFMQPPRPLQQSPQHQQQMGQVLQPQTMQQGSINSPPTQSFMQTNERRQIGPPPFVPDTPSVPGGSPNFHSVKQVHGGLPGAGFQPSPVRPPFTPALPAAPPVANSSLPCGQDPAVTHGQSYPGSAQSLIQLYSDIIPEEKGKKKRTRKKKKDDDTESTKAPSTPHSDITAPPTPSASETTSTPTVNTSGELPQLAEPEAVEPGGPSAPDPATGQLCPELESKLPTSDFSQGTPSQQTYANSEVDKLSIETPATVEEVKLETAEPEQRPGQDGPELEERTEDQAKEKAAAGPASAGQSPSRPAGAPASKGDSGNELLKHLLKNKKASSLLNQKPEGGFCSEEDCTKDNKLVERQNPAEVQTLGAQMQGGFGCGNNQLPKTDGGSETKKQRSKRTQRTGEKTAPRSKKRKKEEEEKQALYSTADTFTHLKQLEPLLTLVNAFSSDASCSPHNFIIFMKS
ncbi:hypothetical protein CB1_000174005 [Camelus ferus]|nr:hypothetical protein CB1_000174005 [Camelus ferus]